MDRLGCHPAHLGIIGIARALHGRTACHITHRGQHTAQGIREQELRGTAVEFPDELPPRGIVIRVALVGATATVDMLLQPEGVHCQGGAAAVSGAAQSTAASTVVDIPLAVGAADIPHHEVIQFVIREGGGGSAIEA